MSNEDLVLFFKETLKTLDTDTIIKFNKRAYDYQTIHLINKNGRSQINLSSSPQQGGWDGRVEILMNRSIIIHTIIQTNEFLRAFPEQVYTADLKDIGLIEVPVDSVSFAHNNKIKLQDIPKYKDQYKVLKQYEHDLIGGLESIRYLYDFVSDLYLISGDLTDVLDVKSYGVYDFHHQSDEDYKMHYFEYKDKPLCIVTKYADKSDHNIYFYDKTIAHEFMEEVRNLINTQEENEIPLIGISDSEPNNSYGSTLVIDGILYTNIKNPDWCIGYLNKSNKAYVLGVNTFDDVTLTEVQVVSFDTVGNNIYDVNELVVNNNGTQQIVKVEDLFFKTKE